MEEVKVYTKNGCGQCVFTKKWLKKNGVKFTEINVLEDEKALERVRELGFSALPVIESGDTAFYGFNEEKLKDLKGE